MTGPQTTDPSASTGTTAPAGVPTTMQAVVQERYGLPEEVLGLREVAVPQPGPGQVLLKVVAGSVNALDLHLVTGEPMFLRAGFGLRRPRRPVPGNDVSGVVVALGPDAGAWRVGDEVFGGARSGSSAGGAFAEYAVANSVDLARRPANLPLEDSAALGVAALTALQALRDWGGLRPGQSVLVNGASGGVGTYAVQVAKALGAGRVTAVCSPRNVDTAYELGADAVVDYTRADVTQLGNRFDLFLDNAGSTSLRAARHLLTDGGRYVMVGSRSSRWLHPLPRILATPLVFLGGRRSAPVGKVSTVETADLEQLRQWVEAGVVRPVIEARRPLAEAPAAVEHSRQGHSRGKTLIVP